MTHKLNSERVQQYEQAGYLSPVPAFTGEEATQLRAALERFETEHGAQAAGLRNDIHLIHRWAWDAVTDPRVIGPVVSLLGPNVLLWSTQWFIKEPRDGKFVSLHQDANYWGLEPHDVLTAWIALSDAGPATGPMRFLPGSHLEALHEHDNTYADDNLLSRGQTIKDQLDESKCVLAPLQAGEMSLHHVRLVHGSDRNDTDDRRIGMVLRFCATHVRQTKARDTAVLVTGEDTYGHFDLLPAPEEEAGAAETARHQDSVQQLMKIVMMD